MMKTLKTFVSGLVLSAVCLLPIAVQAAELQPFITLKLSSINDLANVAEKIADMAGLADNDQFQQVIATAQGIKGINPNGIVGFAAADNDGEIVPMLLLPITNMEELDVPGHFNITELLRPFLAQKGEGQFSINSPVGMYMASQKKDYLVITPENAADWVPADAVKLFDDLEKYVFGMKLDLEKVNFDVIEGQIFGPLVLAMSMQTPEAGEQFEKMIELYRPFFKEFSVIMGGIAIDPQTADVEYSGAVVPRKGSNWEKMLTSLKLQPTMFSGFRGTAENNVISFGYSMTVDGTAASQMNYSPETLNIAFEQYEALLTGFIEQIEEEEGTPEDAAEKAKKVMDSVKKIMEKEANKGGSDGALSLNTEGTLLLAGDTVALEEIRDLVAIIKDYAAAKMPEEAKTFIEKNIKKEYITVEGFKVSNLNVPFATLAEDNEKFVPFKDLTLGVFWAVKEMEGKQAIAIAVGLDSAKTEQTFQSALEKTKTLVPVQPPIMTISAQGIGKFLQQIVSPLVVKVGESTKDIVVFQKVTDVLASADKDATITLDHVFKPNQMDGGYRISGKFIQAVISAVKAGIDAAKSAD